MHMTSVMYMSTCKRYYSIQYTVPINAYKQALVPNVLVTKVVKSTSCSGRPVDQSNSLRIGSSRQDVQTPLPPAQRKRTCCSLRSDTENVCCEVRAGTVSSRMVSAWCMNSVSPLFLTSTFLLSMSTTWTLFQYPTQKRAPFARQQRMGCKGFDPSDITECDCRFQPPINHSAIYLQIRKHEFMWTKWKEAIVYNYMKETKTSPELCEKKASVPSAKPAMTWPWVCLSDWVNTEYLI